MLRAPSILEYIEYMYSIYNIIIIRYRYRTCIQLRNSTPKIYLFGSFPFWEDEIHQVLGHQKNGAKKVKWPNGQKIYPPGNGYISHLGKRKIIDSKCHFWGDMLVPWRVDLHQSPLSQRGKKPPDCLSLVCARAVRDALFSAD